MRSQQYTNGVLSVIALFLGLLVVGQFSGSGVGPAQASAQPTRIRHTGDEEPKAGGLVSAADQRKVMIAELRDLGQRLDAIEAILARGLDVKVKEMPPIQLPREREEGR